MTKLVNLPNMLDPAEHTCRAVIETSRGDRSKFALDPQTGAFELRKLLPDGMSFPTDFGFIPGTGASGGDPRDWPARQEEPLPMGSVVNVRLLGVIEAEQTE